LFGFHVLYDEEGSGVHWLLREHRFLFGFVCNMTGQLSQLSGKDAHLELRLF